MAEMQEAFNEVSDTQNWTNMAWIFGGFFASRAAQTAGDNLTGANIPNEAYGVAVAAAAFYLDQEGIAMGGGVFTLYELVSRFGVFDMMEVR